MRKENMIAQHKDGKREGKKKDGEKKKQRCMQKNTL